MSRYYCPFCSSRYQFHKTSNEGVLICGLCGDPLVKKPLINSRRIIGAVAASAFLTPLIIMIIFVIKDFSKEKPPNNSDSLVQLTIEKLWTI
ncbi:Zn ribbon-like protein [Prochlorococcus sp. MIT 0801]|uniref:Zn ribbon-like protein n=1 Tax=Prochlorococcus sp. MIT 0801 TaxID=1501269 RepID=UPI0004F8CB05|nr:Zn ribbon-like protein [Prochlorococcus sp. MIT 0801]AIQ97231.1 hypothetical protein EW15_1139 [Prochlorococcus sp. MIT 0801]